MSTNTSPKKPSPLGIGSPRASPFRRPESPSLARSPSNSNARAITSTSSPSKPPKASTLAPPASPAAAPAPSSPASSVVSAIYSPRNDDLTPTPLRPTSSSNASAISSNNTTPRAPLAPQPAPNDPLSRLNPQLLHSMRESFAVLDRNNDGSITRDDIADMLTQLGLDSSASSLTPYFPSSSSMNLSTYLSGLSAPLSDLSRSEELREAFSAFDVDDSGQVDVEELREALLCAPLEGQKRMSEREVERVMEEFVSRRTFAKGATGARGDVFRYNDFMAEVAGGGAQEVVPA